MYHGLIKLVLVDPSSGGAVFDLLLPHFLRYFREVMINQLFLLVPQKLNALSKPNLFPRLKVVVCYIKFAEKSLNCCHLLTVSTSHYTSLKFHAQLLRGMLAGCGRGAWNLQLC